VLYHWRSSPGSTAAGVGQKVYAWDAGQRAVQECLRRRGIAGQAEKGMVPGTYRIRLNAGAAHPRGKDRPSPGTFPRHRPPWRS
jgi:hypothetical protein